MKEIIERLITALLIFSIVVVLAGCGTVNGLGKDLQNASQSGAKFLEDYGARHYNE